MNEEELRAVATSHLAHDTAATAVTIVALVDDDIRLRATACSLVVVALHDVGVPSSVITTRKVSIHPWLLVPVVFHPVLTHAFSTGSAAQCL